MAFPTVIGTVAHSHVTANATSITVTLPDGSDTAGRLLLAAVSKDGTGVMTWPASPAWTVLDAGDDGGAASRMEVRYRILNGTEGYPATGASISVSGASEEWASSVYLIKGHNSSTNPPEGTPATGTTGNMDPAAETASWGSADNLFIVFGTLDASVTVTGWPANYTGNQHGDNTGGTGGVSHGSASRNLTAASDNPGTYTNGSESWRTLTVVVQPGSEGSTVFKTVTATAIGAVVLSKTLSLHKIIAATALGVATISRRASYLRSVAATAVGVATVVAGRLFARTVNAIAIGVASTSLRLVLAKSVAATAIGVATVTTRLILHQVAIAIALGVAGMSKVFIPYSGGGGGGFLSIARLKKLIKILG